MIPTNLTQTIQSAQSGDNAAFESLFREYSKPVYYLAIKFMKNKEDAEDIAQEVFVTAYQKLPELKNPETFPTWLNRITANKCKNLLRSRGVIIDADISEVAEAEFVEEDDVSLIPELSLDDSETVRMIVAVIDKLPEAQRLCVYAYYYQNLKVAQIAETLDIAETTVRNRLALARQKVKKELERLNHEEGIKLYGIPILFPLLKADANGFELSAEMLNNMLGNITSQTALSAGAVTTASTGTITTAKTVGGIALKTKIIAGITGVAVLLGATVGVILVDPFCWRIKENVPVIASEDVEKSQYESEPKPESEPASAPVREKLTAAELEDITEYLIPINRCFNLCLPYFDDVNELALYYLILNNHASENLEKDYDYDEADAVFQKKLGRLIDYGYGWHINKIDEYVKEHMNPNISINSLDLEDLPNQFMEKTLVYSEEHGAIFYGQGAHGILGNHLEIIDSYKIGDMYYALIEDGTYYGFAQREYEFCCRSFVTLTKNANGNFNIISKQTEDAYTLEHEDDPSGYVQRTEEYDADVEYETILNPVYTLFEGTSQIKQEGVNGVNRITAVITEANGVELRREIKETTIIEDPIPEIINIGAKPNNSTNSIDKKPLNEKFIHPVYNHDAIPIGNITREFGDGFTETDFNGERVPTFTQRLGNGHQGVDITEENINGMPVVTCHSGRVIFAQFVEKGYGNTIIIAHNTKPDLTFTLYAHCDNISVKVGDEVTKGEQIATVGSTGLSEYEKPHLHFEVIVYINSSDSSIRDDPRNYLP